MKALITTFAALLLLVSSVFGQTFVADANKLMSSTQAVMNAIVNNPDLMIVTGRIIDANTKQPISDARINFDKFGDELVNAAIDKNGNYAVALNKKEIGDPIRIIFKVEGYQRYIAKTVRKNASIVDVDLFLRPDSSHESSNGTIHYTMSDDPFNTMIVRFQ